MITPSAGGFEVDDQLKLYRLFHAKISGLLLRDPQAVCGGYRTLCPPTSTASARSLALAANARSISSALRAARNCCCIPNDRGAIFTQFIMSGWAKIGRVRENRDSAKLGTDLLE